MMQLYTDTNQLISLTELLGQGGEATIYHVAEYPDLVAKIYHKPTATHEAKIRAMIANPPQQSPQHIAIAWPTELLYQAEAHGEFVGFLMPKVTGSVPLFQVYNPALRAQLPYPFNWHALHRTAYNLARVIAMLHAKGYVVGDINESNILVNKKALVTLVDCDSFQVTDEAGRVYRCLVGKAEYTPPELQGLNLKLINQSVSHDLFGLGVLIFQLLMNGFHPFAGVLATPQSVGRVDLYAIREGLFPYYAQTALKPPPAAPRFDQLYPEVQQAFITGFVAGHQQANLRPTAEQWAGWLKQAENQLTTCAEKHHVYSGHLPQCPHCVSLAPKKLSLNRPELSHEAILRLEQIIQAYQQGEAKKVMALAIKVMLNREAEILGEAYAYRAWGYYRQGNIEGALSDCKTALTHNPALPLTYYVYGQCDYRQGDYEAALTAYHQALRLGYEPQAELYYERSKVFEALGQYQEARQDLYRVSTLTSGTAQADEAIKVIALLDSHDHPLTPPTVVPHGVEVNEALQCITFVESLSWGLLELLGVIASYGAFFLLFPTSFYPLGVVLLFWSYSVAVKLFNQTTITVNNHHVVMTNGPIPTYQPSEVRFEVSAIKQLSCRRHIEGNKTSYCLYILSQSLTLFINKTDYDQVRFIQWKLRTWLNLSDDLQPFEHVPHKRGKVNGGSSKHQQWSLAIYMTAFTILLGGLMVCSSVTNEDLVEWIELGILIVTAGLFYFLDQSLTQIKKLLNRGRITQAKVMQVGYCTKEGDSINHHNLRYVYHGYEAEIDSLKFNQAVKVGELIPIRYLPHEPHISRPVLADE